MEIFRAESVEKKYANHLALDDVSITVKKGRIFGLLGPNGAGKTTLIRIINQITAPDKGKLYFKEKRLSSADIPKIGYLPEERGLYKKMKVGEQALYLARLKGVPKNDALKKLKTWFEKFEIETWWDKKIEELSKGMQQKIQFIVTVLHDPELLIFDEPFSGFDPINTNLLKKEILKFRENGATIIFSTHNMASVEEICDDIALINKSRCILEGSIDDIRNTYKTNTYEIRFQGDIQKMKLAMRSNFEVISESTNHNSTTVQVKALSEIRENELLAEILPAVNILEFKEVIPNMNEIFIKVVEESK
jgi:ABC-2 type transport system ATP-binding protein